MPGITAYVKQKCAKIGVANISGKRTFLVPGTPERDGTPLINRRIILLIHRNDIFSILFAFDLYTRVLYDRPWDFSSRCAFLDCFSLPPPFWCHTVRATSRSSREGAAPQASEAPDSLKE